MKQTKLSYWTLWISVSLLAITTFSSATVFSINIMDCLALSEAFPGKVHLPGSAVYTASKTSYFAAFENELSPSCFIQPTKVEEVAEIVKFIKLSSFASQTQVAVRSGGHTAWAGSANVNNGITIDLSELSSITLDQDEKIVSLGVGGRWANVYETLATKGLAVVGGRVSKVGIGGLTLGGGLSYFSEETGFVCDNVISFEVVLASGEIVKASKDSHADLFVALKGGSGNFGIVTRIDLPTFKLGQMWGGGIIYDKSAYPSLVKAFNDFAINPTPDNHAAIIVAASWVPGQGEIGVSNLYYKESTASPPSLKPFVDIQPQLMATLRNDSLLGFAKEQSAFSTDGARQWFFTTGFRVDTQFMIDIHELWLATVNSLQSQPDVVVSLVFQPVTKGIINNSLARGNNSLGLSESDGPFVVCLLNTVHSSPASDDTVSASILKLIQEIEDLAEIRGLSSRYRFLNYGYKDQKIIEGYGPDSIAQLKAASEKYDPTGFFQTIVSGGFKISKTRV